MTTYANAYFGYSSRRLSYVGAILSSRRELVRDWIAAAFEAIDSDEGFRTDPEVHKHFLYPAATSGGTHICIILENETMTALDDNETEFDSDIKVVCLGRFNATVTFSGTELVSGSETDGEYLLDDMKRVVYTLMLSDVNLASNRKLILGKKGVNMFGPTYYPGNQGECRLEFWVRIYAQDGEF